MQKKTYILLLLVLFTKSSFALTRGDIKIIEARENIQYLGQKISTDYFLLYKRPNDFILKNKFQKNIQDIEKNIQDIRNTTKNKVTINILDFYLYRLDYIKELPLIKPQHSDARRLLGASEYFLEGATSISEQHQYKSSKEERMLRHCKKLKYLVESVSMYYMAYQIGLRETKSDVEMQRAIQNINKKLITITKYNYPFILNEKLEKLKIIWKYNQTYFEDLEKTSYTNLLLSSNSYIKSLVIELEKHHKQNL
jgi:hypothetical protein